MEKKYLATTPILDDKKKREVETTKDGFVITRDNIDGTEVIFNDETGIYEVE